MEEALKDVWITDKAPKTDVILHSGFVDNLRSFRSHNKFKKMAVHVIASQFDDKQIKMLRETFIALDANSNGLLAPSEMETGLKKAGMKDIPAALKEILLQDVDADGSGLIDYTEFLSATLDKKIYMEEDVCWDAFRVFDHNGDGQISPGELTNHVLIDPDVQSLVPDTAALQQQIDSNKDGLIKFEEFMDMMRTSGPAIQDGLVGA